MVCKYRLCFARTKYSTGGIGLQLQIGPQFVTYTGSSPAAYVVSLNLHRRHLDTGQRAMVGVKLLPLLEQEARTRQKILAGTRPNAEMDLTANLPEGTKTTLDHTTDVKNDVVSHGVAILPDRENKGESRQKAAAAVNVSPRSISDAKAVRAADPDLAMKVEQGTVSLGAAVRQIKTSNKKTVTASKPHDDWHRFKSLSGKIHDLISALNKLTVDEEHAKEAEERRVALCEELQG